MKYDEYDFFLIGYCWSKILDIAPEWPESRHGSRILENSRIYMRYAQSELHAMLLGDNG